jgi:predicted amidohydrolase YtcJ
MPHSDSAPTRIIHNAHIYTVDRRHPLASAIALQGRRILALGSNEAILALKRRETELIDAVGRLILPGLCDAHIHFHDWSLSLGEVQLAGCSSLSDMLARIKARAEAADSTAWLTGRGWNESFWGQTTFPTRTDLDSVTGEHQPAAFWRSDMHVAVANSAALKAAGITADTPNPPGGLIDRDSAGEPTGVLRELAIMLVRDQIPHPSEAELDGLLLQGMARLHQHGITALHDQRMKDHHDGPRALAAYQRLRRAGKLKLRVNCNIAAHDLPHLAALGVQSGFGDDYLRLGHVKVFTDGSLGSRTCWMLDPFEPSEDGPSDNVGVSVTPPAQMRAEFRQATELGFPISVHAIGDRANRVCLDIFTELANLGLEPPSPHRIEHVQIIHPADLPRLAALNLTASVQPVHATDDIDLTPHLLGERAERAYNFRTLADNGTRLALGSDAPVASENPFAGFHAALCRQRVSRMERGPWFPAERLTLPQTIAGYTLGPAEATSWADSIGSLTPGKRADLIILDRNLFDMVETGITGDELINTQVLLTMFDGEIVYQHTAF